MAKMPPEGKPKGSKIDFQKHLTLKTRILANMSLGLSTSVKQGCSSKIQYLYFDNTNPVFLERAMGLLIGPEEGQLILAVQAIGF